MQQLEFVEEKDITIATAYAWHNLANDMDTKAFSCTYFKIQVMICTMINCITSSMHGRKDFYYTIRDHLQKELEEFFETYDNNVIEQHEKRIKEQH